MQHIAFDLGNVLLDLDWAPFYHVLDELNISHEEMNSFMKFHNRSDFCGLITLKQAFEESFDQTEVDLLIEGWNAIIRPHDQMVNFVKQLKYEGVKVAFLSNMGFDHLNLLRKDFPDFMNLADVQHMSCEVGAAKPSIIYYQSFLLEHEDFAGCLYLDDLYENVIMGSKVKFESMQFDLNNFKNKPPSLLKKELTKIQDRMLKGS